MRSQCILLTAFLACAPLAFSAANPHIIISGDPPNPIIITSTSFTFGAVHRDAAGAGNDHDGPGTVRHFDSRDHARDERQLFV